MVSKIYGKRRFKRHNLNFVLAGRAGAGLYVLEISIIEGAKIINEEEGSGGVVACR